MWLLSCYCYSMCIVCSGCSARKIENPTVWTFTDVISIKNSAGIKAKHLMDERRRKKNTIATKLEEWFLTTAYLPLFMFRIQNDWMNFNKNGLKFRMYLTKKWEIAKCDECHAIKARQNVLKIFIYLTYFVIIQMYGCIHISCYTI